jgi:hypothetical protein
VLGEERVDQLVVALGSVGLEGLVARGVPLDLVAGDGDVHHLTGLDLGHELAELLRRLLLLELGEVPGQEDDDQQRHPQQHRLEGGVHFSRPPDGHQTVPLPSAGRRELMILQSNRFPCYSRAGRGIVPR